MQDWVDLGGILLENSFCQNLLFYDIVLDNVKSISYIIIVIILISS